MADPDTAPHDPSWYRDQWKELMDLLPTTDPETVVDRVRELQIQALNGDADVLDDVGLTDVEDPRTVLRKIFHRLQQLRRKTQILQEIQDTVNAESTDSLVDAIAALKERAEAYEEQQEAFRKAGFEQPEDALEAFEDEEEQEASGEETPETILTTIRTLADQLEKRVVNQEGVGEPYQNGAEEALEMVKHLQKQLAGLREHRAQLSERGVDAIDDALSVIERMKSQLGDGSSERTGEPRLEDVSPQLDDLGQKLSDLTEEIARLQKKRDRLQAQLDALEEEFGTDDPEVLSKLVRSLESQLFEFYKNQETHTAPSATDAASLFPEDVSSRLDELETEDLDALPVGIFQVDDRGRIQHANENVLRWPDATVETPDALVGTPFFEDVAPGANSELFRGKFEDGVERGAMDEQFFYTYVSIQGRATNLAVSLHSRPDQSSNWIVFRILEQH